MVGTSPRGNLGCVAVTLLVWRLHHWYGGYITAGEYRVCGSYITGMAVTLPKNVLAPVVVRAFHVEEVGYVAEGRRVDEHQARRSSRSVELMNI